MKKQDVKKVVDEYGAAITDTEPTTLGCHYQFYIDAPDGYLWSANGSSVLSVVWDSHAKGDKTQAFKDAISRMKHGIDKKESI